MHDRYKIYVWGAIWPSLSSWTIETLPQGRQFPLKPMITYQVIPQSFEWTWYFLSCRVFYDVPTRTLRWSEGSQWRCSSPTGVAGRMRSWDLVWTSPVHVGLVLTGLEVAWWPYGWKARAGWRRNGPSSARRTRTHGCLCQYRPHSGTNEHMPCSLGKHKQGRRSFMKMFNCWIVLNKLMRVILSSLLRA